MRTTGRTRTIRGLRACQPYAKEAGDRLARPYYDHMRGRRWSSRWVPAAALTLGAAVAFVFQLVAVAGIAIDWAGAYDVMHGDCGWDGTCSQAGSLPVTLWCALALVSAEFISGLVTLSAKRLAVAVIAGCVASWVIALQDRIVFHLAAARYPGVLGTQGQGQFFITWSARAVVAETALALLAWLVVARLRRSNEPTRLTAG